MKAFECAVFRRLRRCLSAIVPPARTIGGSACAHRLISETIVTTSSRTGTSAKPQLGSATEMVESTPREQ